MTPVSWRGMKPLETVSYKTPMNNNTTAEPTKTVPRKFSTMRNVEI